jgi:nucleoside-diphosphate-sugar epimerase
VKKETILITGANGQIGSELVSALQKIYGEDQVLATDIRHPKEANSRFALLDILDKSAVQDCITDNKITQVYHLAALLSSKGEDNPDFTWQLNFNAYLDLLKICRSADISRIFFPSTIGVYGPTTPKIDTPQNTSLIPGTVYGISKITAELWNNYYRKRFGLDIRGLRYPGVISYKTRPQGGTTDFAVEIFFDALEKGSYECYLEADTRLPMMYMPDVLKATLDLMHAEKVDLSTGMAYNVAGFSLTPAELYAEINKYIPALEIKYVPDHRQAIAESWTESIDDSHARKDWSWAPSYNMKAMVKDMIENMRTQ